MEIKKCDRINATPVVPVALKGQLELIERGLCTHNQLILGWDHKAIYAEEDGVVIGVIVYEESQSRDEISVIIGYVLPDHRRKGVYRQMWNRLVAEAQELEFTNIAGATRWNNYEMQETMRSLGRHPSYIGYDFDVPKK